MHLPPHTGIIAHIFGAVFNWSDEHREHSVMGEGINAHWMHLPRVLETELELTCPNQPSTILCLLTF